MKPLTLTEIDRLGELLASVPDPFVPMEADQLDGFLTALCLLKVPPSIDDWFIYVLDASGNRRAKLADPAEHAELLIRVAVVLRARAQLADPGDLRIVFRQMALHRQVVFHPQPRQPEHQIVRARRDEARGQDGPDVGITLLRLADPALGVAQGLVSGDLAQVDRRVAVHIDLAHEAFQPHRVQLLHEKLRRGHMDGGKDGRARGRAAQQMRGEAAIRPFGVVQVLVFGFLREGIGVEPLQQLHIHAEPAEGELRRVDMQVGHTGQDQPMAVIEHRQRGIARRQRLKDAGDAPLLHNDAALFQTDDLVHAPAEADISLYYISVHCPVLLCFQRFSARAAQTQTAVRRLPIPEYHIIISCRNSTYVLGRSSRNQPAAIGQL